LSAQAGASATTTASGVVVRWRTGTEADLLGFHVYRSRGHSWQRLTRSLIAAAPSPVLRTATSTERRSAASPTGTELGL